MAQQVQEPAYAQRWANPDVKVLDESLLDPDMSLMQSPLTFYNRVPYD
jgi:hypothetical protein